jgi:hypothetical protein
MLAGLLVIGGIVIGGTSGSSQRVVAAMAPQQVPGPPTTCGARPMPKPMQWISVRRLGCVGFTLPDSKQLVVVMTNTGDFALGHYSGTGTDFNTTPALTNQVYFWAPIAPPTPDTMINDN